MVSLGFLPTFLYQKSKLASHPVILINGLLLPLAANHNIHVFTASPERTFSINSGGAARDAVTHYPCCPTFAAMYLNTKSFLLLLFPQIVS